MMSDPRRKTLILQTKNTFTVLNPCDPFVAAVSRSYAYLLPTTKMHVLTATLYVTMQNFEKCKE